MHAIVIGAGVIGSSIALQLRRLGHDVTVIGKQILDFFKMLEFVLGSGLKVKVVLAKILSYAS